MGIPGTAAMSAANRVKRAAELNRGDVTSINGELARLRGIISAIQTLVYSPAIGNVRLDARLKALE